MGPLSLRPEEGPVFKGVSKNPLDTPIGKVTSIIARKSLTVGDYLKIQESTGIKKKINQVKLLLSGKGWVSNKGLKKLPLNKEMLRTLPLKTLQALKKVEDVCSKRLNSSVKVGSNDDDRHGIKAFDRFLNRVIKDKKEELKIANDVDVAIF